jgi:hypothetical protein
MQKLSDSFSTAAANNGLERNFSKWCTVGMQKSAALCVDNTKKLVNSTGFFGFIHFNDQIKRIKLQNGRKICLN